MTTIKIYDHLSKVDTESKYVSIIALIFFNYYIVTCVYFAHNHMEEAWTFVKKGLELIEAWGHRRMLNVFFLIHQERSGFK